jgi:cyclopropane-fatty-acyl-phospholipid synthase
VRESVATGPATFSSDRVAAPSNWLDRRALEQVQRAVASAPLRFRLWDGFELQPISGSPIATIVFKNRRALVSWVWDPDLNFGEAYMFGAVEIHGDLLAVLEAIYRASVVKTKPWRRLHLPNGQSAAKANVHHHYDLGNDFYELWLDRHMAYSCAYFPTPAATIDDAQIAKMALVCRKLRLQPGERVVEAGCGWGTLALFMAKHFGVSVRAFNVSAEQIAYARQRAAAEGLTGRVEFVEDDYRNLAGTCDAFVSVGMLEHVGLAEFPAFATVVARTLGEHGRGLLHFIGRDRPAPLNPWIRKRIFPGAYPPTLHEVFEHILEPMQLSVLDVENLRLHYAWTLAHWRERFDRSADRIAAMFDEPFVRAWRLYLAGSQAAFETGWMQLFQVVFARAGSNALPWTRADIFAAPPLIDAAGHGSL